MYEPGVFNEIANLRKTLIDDLEMVNSLLSKRQIKKIKKSTKIWLNKTISFGPSSKPVVGSSCTYHPKDGSEWLRQNGLREDKAGSVEIYCAEEYLGSRGLWGVGGVLLHELCHSYHDQQVKDGFDNDEIRIAFNKAMQEKRYESVAVHGRQGVSGPAKHYACTNCMEFFAELSVAFHWIKDSLTEYNKWFPFNREQLKVHDPSTYVLLCKIWS